MTNMTLANNPPMLGFGYMRLPEVDGEIDFQQVNRMVDQFMASGFNYFDTAYGYHEGKSEDALRISLVERYPRDQFTVATKMPIWAVEEAADVQRIFDTQLQRTGAGYFDYYMIHALDAGKLEKLAQYDVWAFLVEQKKKGLARHIGISFHDKADVLDRVLGDHPELEFVQLQLNYADWDDADVQAGACYEACMKHGVPVVVMEPVKGGSLAQLSEEAQQTFKAARPDASIASWAMRFCGSLDGVISVLSGMSNEDQVLDNINTIRDFEPLTVEDRATVARVRAILSSTPTIPCTGCKYCIEDCPQHIQIPGVLNNYNDLLIYGDTVGARRHYAMFIGNPVKASACIECGLCEARCPQHIQIIARLKDCVEALEA